MKQCAWLLAIIFSLLSLMSCTSHYYPYLRADLTKENWLRSVDTDQNRWLVGADGWFLRGDPNATERANLRAGTHAAVSTTMVRVQNFTKIIVNGEFQVQLFGTNGDNSAYLFGPKEQVRNINVVARGDTLIVAQVNPLPGMHQVIVRIGVNQLSCLTQLGFGTIEGIRLRSNNLTIASLNTGNIYLAGDLNVSSVRSDGGGSITVIGAKTPCLNIVTTNGCVNICGKVGIRSIVHRGMGDINIIGANSDGLTVSADGMGKIGIQGIVNLHNVRMQGNTALFVTQIDSPSLAVVTSNHAYVGVAGRVGVLRLEALDSSNFLGRRLCVGNAYLRSKDSAHVNVSVNNRVFASTQQNSSIYLFGRPKTISQFVRDKATVVDICAGARSSCSACG